jgi:hypothetical protein
LVLSASVESNTIMHSRFRARSRYGKQTSSSNRTRVQTRRVRRATRPFLEPMAGRFAGAREFGADRIWAFGHQFIISLIHFRMPAFGTWVVIPPRARQYRRKETTEDDSHASTGPPNHPPRQEYDLARSHFLSRSSQTALARSRRLCDRARTKSSGPLVETCGSRRRRGE